MGSSGRYLTFLPVTPVPAETTLTLQLLGGDDGAPISACCISRS